MRIFGFGRKKEQREDAPEERDGVHTTGQVRSEEDFLPSEPVKRTRASHKEHAATTPAPRTALIESSKMSSVGDIHHTLKEELGFPDYYGGNLSALADCLSEQTEPVRIEVVCANDYTDLDSYLFRLANVCVRQAFANEHVSFLLRHATPEPRTDTQG